MANIIQLKTLFKKLGLILNLDFYWAERKWCTLQTVQETTPFNFWLLESQFSNLAYSWWHLFIESNFSLFHAEQKKSQILAKPLTNFEIYGVFCRMFFGFNSHWCFTIVPKIAAKETSGNSHEHNTNVKGGTVESVV